MELQGPDEENLPAKKSKVCSNCCDGHSNEICGVTHISIRDGVKKQTATPFTQYMMSDVHASEVIEHKPIQEYDFSQTDKLYFVNTTPQYTLRAYHNHSFIYTYVNIFTSDDVPFNIMSIL